MNRFAVFLVTCLFAALSMAAMTSRVPQTKDKPTSSRECALRQEDYAVYSAALLDRGRPEDPEERWDDKPDLILLDVTDSGEDGKSKMWGFRSNSRQRPSDDTIDHFNSRRMSSCEMESHLDAAISYRFLSKDEHARFFKKSVAGGWADFYKKYPKSSGYWSLSPVGYDTQGSEALIYVGHHCGYLCGTGHLVLLAKESGRWVVKNRLMLWIS